jgi:hypothetical protein
MTIHSLQHSRTISFDFEVELIRGVEIAGALTKAASRGVDLADAFDWIEGMYPSHDAAQEITQVFRDRACSVHGTTTSHGSVLVPSRALNNEVAYMVFCVLQLQFDVRLTGLRSAAHLNGRQGVIRGKDPVNDERWKTRLDGGTWVSVKAVNFEHVRRGDYRRRSP